MTSELTSSRNILLKDVRRAVSRGTLTERGLAVAEGFHLLEEALRSDCNVECVLALDSVRGPVESHVKRLRRTRVYVLPDELFRQISATETSQGVVALVTPPKWKLEELFRGRSLVVILDGIQDPGNAGAIVRSAEAFGATGALFLKGTVDRYNPKTLRASGGSLFRLPTVADMDPALGRAAVEQRRMDLYAAMPKGQKNLDEADLSRRFALIVGSEGRGVSEKLRRGAIDLRIPTAGVESLNVAMATGVILYEARRQRLLRQ
jgi:TrmH family RNA methyltransferase